jgi:nicotinamide mononucleotide adenylyltransferase
MENITNSLRRSSNWDAKLQQSPSDPIPSNGYKLPRHRLGQLKDPKKIPLVLVACGSYSPVTYLHLRMFEMGADYIADHNLFEIIGGYFSPVSDAYAKPGLAASFHRVKMCELAVQESSWIMVDHWVRQTHTGSFTERVYTDSKSA